MRIRTLLALSLLQTILLLGAENLLSNPGFEEVTAQGHPASWGLSGLSDHRSLDDTTSHSGKYSLKFSNAGSPHSGCLQRFGDIANLQDDYVFRGWVKYEGLSNAIVGLQQDAVPFVGIWTSVAGGGNSIRFNAFELPPGDSDWRYFEKVFRAKELWARIGSLKPEKRPQTWAFAIRIYRQPGTIWFDDLEFSRLLKPDRLEGKLSSSVYSTDSPQAILTIQAITATGAEALAATDIAVKIELSSESAKAPHAVQDIILGATPIKVALPLHGLREGQYRVTMRATSGDFQPCELTFT